MAEVVYVPIVQAMTERDLREFQARLDALGRENGWDGVFVVMRGRPARSWCCGSVTVPVTHAKEVP